MAKNNKAGTNMKFVINKKYRFKRDYSDTSLGKIPQGLTATFVCNFAGCSKFKLPNGIQVAIQEESAPVIFEELH
jgi:hypothetical protein